MQTYSADFTLSFPSKKFLSIEQWEYFNAMLMKFEYLGISVGATL